MKKISLTMRQLQNLSVLAALWMLRVAVLTDAVPYYEEDDDKALYDPKLFEGDIEITQEQFEKFYSQPQNGKSGTVSMIVRLDPGSTQCCMLIKR